MDLLYHFIAGAAMGIALLLIFGRRDSTTHLRPDWAKALAGLFPLVAGVLKELFDMWWGSGTPEVADVTLTWTGGIVGVAIILLIDVFTTDKY